MIQAVLSRRQLLKLGLAGSFTGTAALAWRQPGRNALAAPATPAAVPGFDDPRRWAGKSLRVGAWGSDVQAALRNAVWRPFAAATACKIQEVVTDYSRLELTAKGEAAYADVLVVDPVWAGSSSARAHLSVLPGQTPPAAIPESPMVATGVSQPAYAYAVVSAYRRDGVDDRPPQNWEQWWDEIRFPQNRALQRSAMNNFEFALMANGTPPDQLYPLDGVRAIDSLRAISGKIVYHWWDSGLEPARWLAAGSCMLTSAWHFRISVARSQGLPVDVVWNQGILLADHWVIPAAARAKDVAADFLKYAATPQVQAALARQLPLGPIDPAAYTLLEAAIIPTLPTAPANLGRLVPRNVAWWATRGAEAMELFNDWLLGVPNG